VNLKGAYFFNQAIARRLIDEGKPGSIISISSQMGHVGGIERAVYCGTKFGVEGFTKAQAIEWGRVGLVEDIMGAVLYLASDAASLVTGTSILVDGGWTAD